MRFKKFCIPKTFLRFQSKEVKINEFNITSYSIPTYDIEYILNPKKDIEAKKDKLEKLLFQIMLQAKNEIQKKDEKIQEKDKKIQEKDEKIQEKDEIIQEKDETILDLALSLERNRTELNEYVLLYLQQKGKVNIRGALEFCFQEILKNTKTLNNKEPINVALQSLQNKTEFNKIFNEKCENKKLRKEDVSKCLGGLYHNASKEFHGKEETIIIYENSWVENERVALASIFTYCGVPYFFADKNGQLISPCPY
jgi:hypothetical protein